MLVRRDVLAIHGERGIAVADRVAVRGEVAEELIVGAVLFDDVDDVLDAAAGCSLEGDAFLRGTHAVGFENLIGELREGLADRVEIEGGNRSVKKRGYVGVAPVLMGGCGGRGGRFV